MSVVAVKIYPSKIVIGADSFVGFNYDTQLKDKDVKIFRQNGLVVGGVGYATDIVLLKLFSKTRKPERPDEDSILNYLIEFRDWMRKKNDKYENKTDFMVVFKSKAFLATSSLYIKEIKTFEAMGAGMNMAQTALHLGCNVREALNVATELSIYCEKPLNIFEVRK